LDGNYNSIQLKLCLKIFIFTKNYKNKYLY